MFPASNLETRRKCEEIGKCLRMIVSHEHAAVTETGNANDSLIDASRDRAEFPSSGLSSPSLWTPPNTNLRYRYKSSPVPRYIKSLSISLDYL